MDIGKEIDRIDGKMQELKNIPKDRIWKFENARPKPFFVIVPEKCPKCGKVSICDKCGHSSIGFGGPSKIGKDALWCCHNCNNDFFEGTLLDLQQSEKLK